MKCILRTYGNTTCLVLIVSLTISKINHIIAVFNLKYRLTKWTMIKLKTTELLIVVISLLIKLCISITLFDYLPIHITSSIDHSKAERNDKCINIDHHIEYQTGFILFLEILCGLQAFRGRKLPTNYNEAKYVAFAMFTSTLILATGVPLYRSMKNVTNQNFMIAVITILANMAILLALYGYKIMIIWFYPDYNSQEVFQRERMEKVITDTEKRLSTVTCYSIGSLSERNKSFVQTVIQQQKQNTRKIGVAVEFHKKSFYQREISSVINTPQNGDAGYIYDDAEISFENPGFYDSDTYNSTPVTDHSKSSEESPEESCRESHSTSCNTPEMDSGSFVDIDNVQSAFDNPNLDDSDVSSTEGDDKLPPIVIKDDYIVCEI